AGDRSGDGGGWSAGEVVAAVAAAGGAKRLRAHPLFFWQVSVGTGHTRLCPSYDFCSTNQLVFNPSICRNWPTHIPTAQISRMTAKNPKATRPTISSGMNPKPPKLPLNWRSPGPKAIQSKLSAKQLTRSVASEFRHLSYPGGKLARIPPNTN